MVGKKYFSMLAGATFSSVINALLIIVDSIICGLLVEYEKNLEPKLQGADRRQSGFSKQLLKPFCFEIQASPLITSKNT